MQRILIVGASGSGKSTLGRALGERLAIPYVELDGLYHLPNWGVPDPTVFAGALDEASKPRSWVIDGNYADSSAVLWERADTLVWLDLPRWFITGRVIRRTFDRVIHKTPLWNGNCEKWRGLLPIGPEKSIIAWAYTRHPMYRARYGAAMSDPKWSHLRFVRLASAGDVRQFLADSGSEGGIPVSQRDPAPAGGGSSKR